MKRSIFSPLVFVVSPLALTTRLAFAQPFDITTFDPTSMGPWSEPGRTTLVVPKVPNGSVQLDGAVSSQEYGGFQGITVTPGTNAWILDFPADRTWDGPDDSSFTYWLAHDDDYLYVGVLVKDDVVNSDDPNASFWRDDSIEIVVDALTDRFDINTDNSKDPVGGHCYVNYQGRFSAWDETAGQIGTMTWATAVNWTYGANGDVFGFGKSVTGGWQMEVRFKKRMFEDPTLGNKLRNGYRMGFNIGLDDDDKHGTGTNGDMTRTQDLEVQYWWANRQRHEGLTADFLATLTPEQKQDVSTIASLPLVLDSAGRLAHGGTGEILFGYDPDPSAARQNILFVTVSGDSPVNADPALIALLQARGYTVTPFTAANSTAEDLRGAAAGKQLVIISESIGSTSVVDPPGEVTGVFTLKDTDVPILSFEPYMWDNADWTARTVDGANDWTNWGNTGRSEVPVEVQDARDSLYILKPAHPIAGGLSGKVKVYDPFYSFNFGIPSADAEIVASVQPDASYPTIFVYEKGDKLVDGSIAPNKRIGFFLGQLASPNANAATDYAFLTETGRTLFLNTVAFAIGTGAESAPLQLSVAQVGGRIQITWTDSAAKLESAGTVTGPWSPVPNATSPYQQDSSAALRQFFRLSK